MPRNALQMLILAAVAAMGLPVLAGLARGDWCSAYTPWGRAALLDSEDVTPEELEDYLAPGVSEDTDEDELVQRAAARYRAGGAAHDRPSIDDTGAAAAVSAAGRDQAQAAKDGAASSPRRRGTRAGRRRRKRQS